MRPLFALILLIGSAFGTTIVTNQPIQSPTGSRLNGRIVFSLPAPATNTSTNTVVTPVATPVRVVNGLLASTLTLPGNDILSPKMYYDAYYYDSTGRWLSTYHYYITGTTFDLGSAPLTPVTTSNISQSDWLINALTVTGPANLNGGGQFGGLWNKADPTTNSILQLQDLGTRNAQLIGFGVEQFANPTTTPFSQFDFGQVTELDIPTSNAVVFTGNQTATYGSFSHFGSGAVSSGFGGGFEGFNPGPATDLLIGGVQATANNGGVATGTPLPIQTPTNNGSVTNARAFDGIVNNKSTGTLTNGVVFYAEPPTNSGGGTFVNAYGLKVGDMTAAATNYAIFTGLGKVDIGDVARFRSTLQLDNSATIGGSPSTTTGLQITPNNLTGTFQFGQQNAPICTSAATSLCEGLRVRFDTAAAAFTVPSGSAIHITEGNKGAGSAVTTERGIWIDALSNGGTNVAIEVANPIKTTLATGTAPLIVTSTTPVANLTTVPTAYDHTGAQLTGYHLVEDSCVLGTSCAVTLTGSAVYTSSTSYTCVCQDDTAIASCKVAQSSGSAFTITGTGTDTIRYHCGGN